MRKGTYSSEMKLVKCVKEKKVGHGEHVTNQVPTKARSDKLHNCLADSINVVWLKHRVFWK